ncbi:DUF1488 family protein [Rhizobium sp. G187]|uniref:DUF1488 family protein n=1 Tax=Rhizobium sp. G187 TaxID=3451352 RepID=UPI003EE6EDBD
MTLSFSNPSRAYDDTRGLIRFIGYDGLNQILFLLPVAAFHPQGTVKIHEERDYLMAFDRLRSRILDIARAAYERKRRPMVELELKAFGSSLQKMT